MKATYPACFYKEDNGYSVIFPDLQWLATDGDTIEEAMENAIDCLAGYLFTAKMTGEKVAEPSSFDQIDPYKVERELEGENSAEECFVNLVHVDVDEYAKEHFMKSVKKTLTIPAWLDQLAREKDISFSKTLQDALIKMLL